MAKYACYGKVNHFHMGNWRQGRVVDMRDALGGYRMGGALEVPSVEHHGRGR
jgi:hypothetical protein